MRAVLISVVNRNVDTPLPLSQSATIILRHQGLESQRRHEGAAAQERTFMTSFTPAPATADLGVFGLGVMGANLARNLARYGPACG